MKATRFGIYMSLLVEEWGSGPLPDDDEDLREMGRAPIDRVRLVLTEHFQLTSDGWVNEVLEEIWTEQAERHKRRVEAGQKGGLSKAQALLEQSPSSKEGDKKKEESIYTSSFEEWWIGYPRKIGKKSAFRKWRTNIGRGVTVAEMADGRDRYIGYLRALKIDPPFVKHPVTFLGPDEWWSEEWDVPKDPPRPEHKRLT